MKVVIVGIGRVGEKLADRLGRQPEVELVLIDLDEKRCERLAGSLDALVLHGDGTDPEVLKEARVPEADALVATTDSDPLNTVIAMLGRRMGVEKIIVKLNEVGLRAACQEIGGIHIIAPKISAAAEIFSILSGYDQIDLSLLVQGGLRLAEIGVGAAAGKNLADLELPESLLVVAVLRGQQVLIPRGRTRLAADDVLLVLFEKEQDYAALKELLARDR